MVKRMAAAGLSVLLLSGALQAASYTFQGNKFNETLVATGVYGANWDNASNWSPASVPPGTTGDRYYVGRDANGAWLASTANVAFPNPGAAGNTRYFGSVTVDNGNLYIPTAALGTFRFVADNGQSGSLIVTGVNARMNRAYSGSKVNFVMDGSFIIDPSGANATSGWWGETASKSTVTMKGTGVTYQVDSAISRDHSMYYVTVDNGANVNFATVNGGVSNAMANLELRKGSTVSGTVLLLWDGKERLKVTSSDVNHSNLDVRMLPVTAYFTKPNPAVNFYVGDGQFLKGAWRDVEFGLGVNGTAYDNAQYTAHLLGATHVRNLLAGYNGTEGFTGAGGATYVIDTDNQFIGSSSLTVDQDLTLGANVPGGWTQHKNGALKANNSQVKVGGNISLKYANDGGYLAGAWMTAGSATIRLGGSFTVDCGTLSGRNWNMGTSTLLCDGNGTSKTQTLATKGLPFCNLTVNNPGGVVSLTDNVVLNGNFYLQAGVLRTNASYLNFHGGRSTLATAETLQLDNATGSLGRLRVQSGSSTWVKLLSDLKVTDNLVIDSGCELLLNGHTLTVTGGLDQGTYSGSGSWTVRAGGLIVGAAGVPEPATLLLLGSGLLGGIGFIRRRRMQ